jgi:hypothetical protein
MVAAARGFCVDFAGRSRHDEEPPSWLEPAEKADGAKDMRSGEAKETRVPRSPIGQVETSVARKVQLTVRLQSGRRLFGRKRQPLTPAVIAICVVRNRRAPRLQPPPPADRKGQGAFQSRQPPPTGHLARPAVASEGKECGCNTTRVRGGLHDENWPTFEPYEPNGVRCCAIRAMLPESHESRLDSLEARAR